MLTHLLPVGLKGLVAAAMLAAAMQTCSAALNSTATLVAYDLFKRHKPGLGRPSTCQDRQNHDRARHHPRHCGFAACLAITPPSLKASTS